MTQESEKLLTNLYNAFDPFYPLPAGDPQYVDCREVRGDGDITVDLGKKIQQSQRMTCQLYTGHRGAGKSTELLRLEQHLQNKGCFVVYFAAEEEDIDPEDTEYTDILLACTKHLLKKLSSNSKSPALLNWVKSRGGELKELAQMDVALDSISLESQITLFAKLTANIRAVPSLRQEIRKKINPHTTTLIAALNEYIADAKQHLPPGYTQLAVIVDNLDRIVPLIVAEGRNNHDEIFIDRCGQLKGLDCHVIYTLPISMMYSNRANELASNYDNTEILPMIMVQTPDGNIHEPGVNIIKELIRKRVSVFSPNLSLETGLFENLEILNQICLMSGGHVRNMLQLMEEAIQRTEKLPISATAVQRAITKIRDPFRRTVDDGEWQILAKVSRSKEIKNEEECRKLLFNRGVLEYRYLDEAGEIQYWHDVHPLIKGIKQFKHSLAQLQP